MLLFAQMGLSAAILVLLVRYFRSAIQTAPEASGVGDSGGMGWWALLFIPLVMILGFVFLFIAAMILNTILELIEWLAFCLRRCPDCGCRRWSWGFTRGFGL